MFEQGDAVWYDDRNVNRWVKAIVTDTGNENEEVTIDCDVLEGERPELPKWFGNGQ